MYRTRLTSLSPPTGSRGEVLTFVGDLPVTEGDYVWTDGKIIYGNQPRYNVPVVTSGNGGVPIAYGQVTQSGYFSKTGIWTPADLETGMIVVNDSQIYVTSQNSYLDAVIYDGAFVVAQKVGNNIQIIKDPEGDSEILDEIAPASNEMLTDLIFGDGLTWTIWGQHYEYSRAVLKTTEWVNIRFGGFTLLGTDYYEDHATAHYRLGPPTFDTIQVESYQSHELTKRFVLDSNGNRVEYDVNERMTTSGREVTGTVYTGPVTGLSTFSDLGNAGLWDGTCDCTSYYKDGNDYAWFGPEPLSNINVIQYYSNQQYIDPAGGENWQNESHMDYRYGLQNGYAVKANHNGEELYDGDNVVYSTTSTDRMRAAYGFSNGGGLVSFKNNRLIRYGDEIQELGYSRNVKLNYLRKIKKALKKEE